MSRQSPAASRTMSITHPSRRRALTIPTAYLGTSAPRRGADSAHVVRTGRSSIFLTPAKLDAFVAVAEDGGFSAATRRLHISQPALSQTVNAIERQFGLKLLERSSTGVRATHRQRAKKSAVRTNHRDGNNAIALEVRKKR